MLDLTQFEGTPLGKWTTEPHGKTTALYSGRTNERHGLRLMNLDDGDANFDAYRKLIEAAPDLLIEVRDLRGAMEAQDERERLAGEACGVPWHEHQCDWPQWVAEECKRLEGLWTAAEADSAVKGTTIYHLKAENERLRAALDSANAVIDIPVQEGMPISRDLMLAMLDLALKIQWEKRQRGQIDAAIASPAPPDAAPGTDWRKLCFDLWDSRQDVYAANANVGDGEEIKECEYAIFDAVRREREREKGPANASPR